MADPRSHERRLKYRAEVRNAILEEAERLLSECGGSGFSMRELAARCGCTAPTIYHYFRDKGGLIGAVLEARIERLVRELRALPASDDPVATLCSRAAAFALFGMRHPGHYQLLVAQVGDGSADTPATDELRRLSTESLQDFVARGDLPASELEILRQGIWSLIHGFILLQTARADEEWKPQLLDRSLEAMIRGSLRPQRKASAPTRKRLRKGARA
jgi:AcrR family transcriptional regulator